MHARIASSVCRRRIPTSDVKKAAHCIPFYNSSSSCRGRPSSYAHVHTVCVPAGTAQARSGKAHRDPNRSSAASPMNDRHGHAMPGGDDDWLSSLLSPLVVVTMSVCLSTDGQDESPIGFIPPGLAWKQHTCWGWGWKGEPSRGRFIGRCNPESADQIWPALV